MPETAGHHFHIDRISRSADWRRQTPAELDELFETKVKPWRFRKDKTCPPERLGGEIGGHRSVELLGLCRHIPRRRTDVRGEWVVGPDRPCKMM